MSCLASQPLRTIVLVWQKSVSEELVCLSAESHSIATAMLTRLPCDNFLSPGLWAGGLLPLPARSSAPVCYGANSEIRCAITLSRFFSLSLSLSRSLQNGKSIIAM